MKLETTITTLMKIQLKYNKSIAQGGFGGASMSPPPLPKAPSKDDAAKNLLEQGMKKPPIGFDSTILGDNTSPKAGNKTLLGN